MKANIKLSLWIPIIFILILVVLMFQEFNLLDIILLLAVGSVVLYFIVGFIRRKDALVIDSTTIHVISPIHTKEFLIENMSHLYVHQDDHSLRATYNGESIKVCTDIYDVPTSDINTYLIQHHPHLKHPQDAQKG